MPAKSQAQQKAAGAALAAKRGQTAVKDLYGAALEMFHSMSESELEELAQVPASKTREQLPEHSTTNGSTGRKR